MKLANKVLEGIAQAEAGDTSAGEDGHWHKTSIDIDGNGKTLETLPKGSEQHTHTIKDNKASGHGHNHKVIA